MEFREGLENINFASILALYNSVGWMAYTKTPDDLSKALENSTFIVTCINHNEIVGLARSISDDISIHYLQDIFVKPEYQRKGIGRALLQKCLTRFKHVRTHLLLTDDEEKQMIFYKSIGFKNIKDLKEIPLNVYVKMKEMDLK